MAHMNSYRGNFYPGSPAALLALLLLSAAVVRGADGGAPGRLVGAAIPAKSLAAVLPAAEWAQVESSVDRGLAWMAAQQRDDGSFPSVGQGQPAVTSLCVMAFLSRGHQPGYGPYGAQMEKAIDFVVSCQMPDGLFSYQTPEEGHVNNGASHTAVYNHAIAGLMLGEVYGHVTGQRMKAVKGAIGKALLFTKELQLRSKPVYDTGGWRYLRIYSAGNDSDLSVTSWQLMFLRSARNAEFDVPQKYIDAAMGYVHRCWDPAQGMFDYELREGGAPNPGRGMTGAGILSLSLAGQHQTPMALAAGDWLLAHPFGGVGEVYGTLDRSIYSMYYCSQAAMQLGGRYWQGIFPPIVHALMTAQHSDGSWPQESGGDSLFGRCYSSAMAVLALTPAYQILPVYQR
jgi:hypothetical protein